MKIIRLLIVILLLLILIGIFGFYWYKLPAGPSRLFCISPGYEIIFSKTAQLTTGEKIILYGLRSKDSQRSPASYLAICSASGTRCLYQFAPVVPEAAGYPRPLMLEQAEIMNEKGEFYIFTSWGETGADYFGTHPILIKYSDHQFKTVKFYKGYLSDSPRIRHIPWTRKDFEVTNFFDPAESVFTILTQRVAVEASNLIELSFYGDDRPHAAQHQYVKFVFPLPPLEEE